MDWSHAFGPAQPLSYFVERLAYLPRHSWLYVANDADRIDVRTPCCPCLVNTGDLSDEEADDLDLYASTIGLKTLLCPDQLEEIIENLRQQHARFTDEDLSAAIDYYWKHDAFIDLSTRAVLQAVLPYHMYYDGNAARLYQLNDGRFQIIDKGALTPLMIGYRYALIEAPLASYLLSLNVSGVSFRPAVIWDRRKDQEHHSHRNMILDQRFEPARIGDLDLAGKRILRMGEEYLLISPELKERLESSPFKYLKFSKGLRGFAGNDT